MKALFKLVLKGSVVSALALATAAVGCSDSDKDEPAGDAGGAGKAGSSSTAGSSSHAGSNNGGDTSTGGTPGEGGASGGATPGQGGAAPGEGGASGEGGAGGAKERPDIVFSSGGDGAGGAGDGPAVARFCNSLTFGTEDDPMDTTMILEIGTGADKVTFTAVSGTCAPMDGEACKAIPLGTDVPVALFDADAPDTELDSGTIVSRGGANWIFYTDLTEGNSPSPIVQGAPIDSPACDDVIFEDVFGN